MADNKERIGLSESAKQFIKDFRAEASKESEGECDHDWQFKSDSDGEFPYVRSWNYFQCKKCGEYKDCKANEIPSFDDDVI